MTTNSITNQESTIPTTVKEAIQIVKENMRVDLYDATSQQEFSHTLPLEHDLQMKIVFGYHLSSIDFYISESFDESIFKLRIWSNFSFPESDQDTCEDYRKAENAVHKINASTSEQIVPYYRYKSEYASIANDSTSAISQIIEAIDRRDYLSQLEREIVIFLAEFKDEHIKKHIERWNINEDDIKRRKEERRIAKERN